jgi:hypothetical protein
VAGELSVATITFRHTARLPARHAIEIVDHRVSPPDTRGIVHDLAASGTVAPAASKMAQPAGALPRP